MHPYLAAYLDLASVSVPKKPVLKRGLPKSGRLDLNQRPFGPQPSGIRCLCVPERPSRPMVHGRGRSGQIGRCIRYQSGTTARVTIGHAGQTSPPRTESSPHARATAPPNAAKRVAALHGTGGVLFDLCARFSPVPCPCQDGYRAAAPFRRRDGSFQLETDSGIWTLTAQRVTSDCGSAGARCRRLLPRAPERFRSPQEPRGCHCRPQRNPSALAPRSPCRAVDRGPAAAGRRGRAVDRGPRVGFAIGA